MPSARSPIRIECINPILRVRDITVSLDYYVNVLGFTKAPWVRDGATFALVSRDDLGIYLCQGDQGQPRTWVWIGVTDVEAFHEEYKATGARIRGPLENYSWAYEMRVQDPDGHVLRFGSAPKQGVPYRDRG